MLGGLPSVPCSGDCFPSLAPGTACPPLPSWALLELAACCCWRALWWFQNELAAILRFGAEELFKEKLSEEEGKSRLQNMDIDEILERAEKVDTTAAQEGASELLSAFTVRAPSPEAFHPQGASSVLACSWQALNKGAWMPELGLRPGPLHRPWH